MRLVSDVHGRVTHVALALPGDDTAAVGPLAECLSGILRVLDPDVRCTVIHHPPFGEALARQAGRRLDLLEWPHARTLRFPPGRARLEGGVLTLGAVPWGEFTPWVQDTFLVTAASTLLASPRVDRPEGGMDAEVPPLLAAHLGWPCHPLPFPLAAANVLVDERHAVIGGDALGQPVEQLNVPGLLRVPRTGPPPLAHQDLYLTLAGPLRPGEAPVALVGSQRAAAAAWGEAFTPDATEAALDAVAADLTAAGYAVGRLPLAREPVSPGGRPAWISYNNALVEVEVEAAGMRRVTLARYGGTDLPRLTALDTAAGDVWGRLGFTLRFAAGPFARLALSHGSVRCLTKVLARA